jgi:hypothetical protein
VQEVVPPEPSVSGLEHSTVKQTVSIEDIIERHKDRLVTTYKDSRTKQTTNNMTLFEVRIIDNQKHILIPSNLDDLVQTNYLYLLFAYSLSVLKDYVCHVGGPYKETMPVNKETELFLNGFGCPLVSGKVPPYDPVVKGSFKKGLFCMLKYLTNTYKNFDCRFVRFGESKHAVQELFGEAWATTKLTEKFILDLILNATKVRIDYHEWTNKYILPKEEIVKRFGLKTSLHLSQTFSEIEQLTIAKQFEDYFNIVSVISSYNYESIDIFAFQKDVLNASKIGKQYKVLCKSMTDDRMKLLYSGSKQEKAKKKHVPVKDLINSCRGTTAFLNTFQINRALGIPKFVVSKVPASDEEARSLGIQLTTWANSFGNKYEKSRIESCKNWILEQSNY